MQHLPRCIILTCVLLGWIMPTQAGIFDLFWRKDAAHLETAPATPSLGLLLEAEFALARGDTKDALATYKQQAMKDKSASVFLRALSLSMQYEPPEASKTFAKAWLDENPDHSPAYFYVAHLAIKAQDYALTYEMLQSLLAQDPKADITEILTGIYPKDAHLYALLETLHALEAHGLQNASLSLIQSGIYMELGNYSQALLHIESALAQDGARVPLVTQKADLLHLMQRTDQMHTYLDQMRSQIGTDKALYLYQVRRYLEQEQMTKAWALLNELHATSSQDADVLLLSGLVGLDLGLNADAKALFSALTLIPGYSDEGAYYLGISLMRLGQTQSAKTAFSRVMGSEHLMDALTQLVALADAKDAPLIEQTFTNIRAVYPHLASQSYMIEADFWVKANQTPRALELLSYGFEENPDDLALPLKLASLIDNPKDKDAILRGVLTREDNNPDALFMLGQSLLAQNASDEEGIYLLERILAISEDDWRFEAGRRQKSALVLADTLERSAQNSRLLEWLLPLYHKTQDGRLLPYIQRASQRLGQPFSTH